MTPEEFILNEVTKGLPDWADTEVREKYSNEILTRYRRSDYKDLTDLVCRIRKDLKLETYLKKGSTVSEYSGAAMVSETTARRRLKDKADKIITEKRPYIYQGWKK
jgi:Fic family protein